MIVWICDPCGDRRGIVSVTRRRSFQQCDLCNGTRRCFPRLGSVDEIEPLDPLLLRGVENA